MTIPIEGYSAVEGSDLLSNTCSVSPGGTVIDHPENSPGRVTLHVLLNKSLPSMALYPSMGMVVIQYPKTSPEHAAPNSRPGRLLIARPSKHVINTHAWQCGRLGRPCNMHEHSPFHSPALAVLPPTTHATQQQGPHTIEWICRGIEYGLYKLPI